MPPLSRGSAMGTFSPNRRDANELMRIVKASRSDPFSEVSCIVPDAEQDSRLTLVQPRHSEEVQALVCGDSAVLDWITVSIKDWQLHQAEVERISRCPDHRGDSRSFQVQFWDLHLLVSIV